MKTIELTQGKVAIVDDNDYEWLTAMGKWFYATRGYAGRNGRSAKRTQIKMHRAIMQVADPEVLVDHRNNDTLDNRRCNLRIATKSQNGMNTPLRKDNTSGHRGVCWSTRDKYWVASICVAGKETNLGYFADLQEAVNARSTAEVLFFGEFRFKD